MTPERPDALDAVLLAGKARSPEELFFVIVNRSTAVCPYDRASLWRTGRRFSPLAVSGLERVEPRSAFSSSWAAALASLKNPQETALLAGDGFRDRKRFDALAAGTGGLSALWIPLPRHRAGILFERWGTDAFSSGDKDSLQRLAEGYGAVWRPPRLGRAAGWGRRLAWLAVLAAVVLAMARVRLPLRVVADCEVAARDSLLVSAPMEGVIDAVLVAPGQRVKAGEPLAAYDARLMEEELKISRRQVEVVEAELAGARARGFSDARYRGETALLEARLEQELARLEALDVRFSRRLVTAPRDGMVQLDDARAWRGRPVATGQAILWLVDPADTRLAIWLPQDDRIDFDLSRPVSVHLHAMGGEPRRAVLTYVSTFAQPTPDGGYGFPAEADGLGDAKPPPLGLRGSAAIYGPETSLGYWLLRRPLAWARRWLGV